MCFQFFDLFNENKSVLALASSGDHLTYHPADNRRVISFPVGNGK